MSWTAKPRLELESYQLPKKIEFLPKQSLFGKMSYFEEQATFYKFFDRIAQTVFAIEPLQYVGETIIFHWPVRKLSDTKLLHEESRLKMAKLAAIDAKAKLVEIGV